MHFIVPVIHRRGIDPEEFCYRYLYDNDEAKTEKEYMPTKEVINELKWTYESKKENPRPGDNEWIQRYKTLANDYDFWNLYCDDNPYYDYDDEGVYNYYNPIGECDWFVVGGRWSDMLMDCYGNGHTSLPANELNIDHPEGLDFPYAVIKEYLDDDTLHYINNDRYDTSKDQKELGKTEWKNITKEACNWGELNGETLYITLIDMHS